MPNPVQTQRCDTDAILPQIRILLRELGVTQNYRGFSQSMDAILLAIEQPNNLHIVSKRIYAKLAERYNVSSSSVERNIRTAAGVAWRNNPALMCELAGYKMSAQPTTSIFIATLATYVAEAQAIRSMAPVVIPMSGAMDAFQYRTDSAAQH